MKASVIYLPDLENPQYVTLRNGFGSAKLDLKFTDGKVASISLNTDPSLNEAITSLSGLISKTSSLISDISVEKSSNTAGLSSIITEIYEVIMVNGMTTFRRVEFE
jgi:hypothetical protein